LKDILEDNILWQNYIFFRIPEFKMKKSKKKLLFVKLQHISG